MKLLGRTLDSDLYWNKNLPTDILIDRLTKYHYIYIKCPILDFLLRAEINIWLVGKNHS